jgi:hypothetical protein
MRTSGIKIDLNSENLLVSNSKKIEKVIKFAVHQTVTKKATFQSNKKETRNSKKSLLKK